MYQVSRVMYQVSRVKCHVSCSAQLNLEITSGEEINGNDSEV